jgi:transposase
LIANFKVATGRVITPSIGSTRTNKDFASHIHKTIATDPEAGWIFVVDQLNIHQSEALVKLVAKECAIAIALELDRKGNLKNIKAMASRRTFLSEPTHRIRFVYTPKHTSWLNQIELWFSILARKVLRRGSFSTRWKSCTGASWSSSSTTTELWPNRSSGRTGAVRSGSKPVDYFHRDALGGDALV